jgi:hypothetical protein
MRPLGGERRHVERRLVGPMQVVEQQHHRAELEHVEEVGELVGELDRRQGQGGRLGGRGELVDTDRYLITIAGLRAPAAQTRARLAPWVTGAAYLDRTDAVERAARARDAFGAEQWNRLAAVKAALDPAGRFGPGLASGN